MMTGLVVHVWRVVESIFDHDTLLAATPADFRLQKKAVEVWPEGKRSTAFVEKPNLVLDVSRYGRDFLSLSGKVCPGDTALLETTNLKPSPG
jgi:hypothetical protein